MKIGDCYINQITRNFTIIITNIDFDCEYPIHYKRLENLNEEHYSWTEEKFNRFYVFDQKITNEQLIKNIIE